MSSSPKLAIQNWKKGIIYLIQCPRAASIPSLSPFSFKLETFIKFVGLPYSNLNNEMKLKSAKGQIPFIELNGQQHADSGNIMRVLIKEYNLPIDAELTPKQIADATAYTLLLEESLFRAILYMRVQDLSWLFSADKGMLRNFTGVKKCMVSNFGPKMFKKQLQKSLQIQGMGRNSLQEVVEIMKRDLSALSTLLGDKPYFFGNKPTSFDATAFGQLAQVFYTPQPVDDVINFAEKTTPNLKAFVERIKKQYWPEWDEVTRTLSMDNGKSA